MTRSGYSAADKRVYLSATGYNNLYILAFIQYSQIHAFKIHDEKQDRRVRELYPAGQ